MTIYKKVTLGLLCSIMIVPTTTKTIVAYGAGVAFGYVGSAVGYTAYQGLWSCKNYGQTTTAELVIRHTACRWTINKDSLEDYAKAKAYALKIALREPKTYLEATPLPLGLLVNYVLPGHAFALGFLAGATTFSLNDGLKNELKNLAAKTVACVQIEAELNRRGQRPIAPIGA